MSGYRGSGHALVTYAILFFVPSTCPVVGAVLPRDPNNGALLYCQACFMCPEWPNLLGDVLRGGDPNDQVRRYVNQSSLWRETVELIQGATRLSQCDWGILYSQGLPPSLRMMSSLRRLATVLEIQAKVLAAEGQYRSALETCICMRRFAAHIGDDTFVMWACSEHVDGEATSTIRYVLGVMPPDEGVLTWLKKQLESVPGAPWCPEEALTRFRDMDVQFWRTHPRELKLWKEGLYKGVDEAVKEGTLKLSESQLAVKEEMQKLTESQLLDRAFQSFDASLHRTLEILRTDLPYSRKCDELTQVTDRAREEAEKGDPIGGLSEEVERLGSYYRLHINLTANWNALKNAIEVYLVKARTGHLPQELPAGLRLDPYSGESFEYEITKEGFVLRCRAKSVDFSQIRAFPFKVRAQP